VTINQTLRRYFNASITFWALLTLPALVWLVQYGQGKIFYGEVLHFTGDFSVQLLIVTLAITPLRLVFPKSLVVRWLLQRRRYLGVASFAYSLLHTAIYLLRKKDIGLILNEATDIGIATGWIALSIMFLLASTSNDYSVRQLKRKWKILHRTVYLIAGLSFIHWVFTAFNPNIAYIHLAILAMLLSLRLIMKIRMNH